MEPLDRLVQGLEQVSEAVGEPELEPDPGRTDWREVERQISTLAEVTKSSLVDPFDEALGSIHDPEERGQVALAVGYLVGEVAVLLQASSLHDGLPLLQEARRMGAGDPEVDASTSDPDAFSHLVRGRWLLKQGRFDDANQVFKQLKAGTGLQVYKDAAQEGLDAPRPMRGGAPTLWTLNGFGISLYGDRDRWDDGTHVKTTYITALFVPLFPLASYRVHDHGDSTFTFYAKQRLTTAARVWQLLVPLGIAAAIAWGLLSDYYDSNRYKAKQAYADARRLDRDGKTKAARRAYEKLLGDYADDADATVVNGAAKRLVSLYGGDVKKPLTFASVSQVELLVQRFGNLPRRAREGPAAGVLTRLLEGWVTAIGKKTNRDTEAGLELLALAERVARGEDLSRVRSTRRKRLLARAEAAASKWPLRALATYLTYPTHQRALSASAKVLERLVAHPFLLLSEEKLVRLWLRHTRGKSGLLALRTKVRAALKTAQDLTRDKDRQALVRKPNEKRLVAYLKAHPTDQQIANAVARLQRQRGASPEAHATLKRLGPPGILIAPARLTLASIYSDLGRPSDASALLEAHLAGRMGRFQKAQRAYQQAASRFQKSLVAQARAGNLPEAFKRRLSGLTEADQRKAFGEWMSKRFRENQQLKRLREAYQSFSTVVPACLTLGMVKLRLARAAGGKRREGLLADAERLFLGIRAEAQGVASYHLALGQVYYRLGKKPQGEKELQGLLAGANPLQHVEVAKAYRQLGMVDRARQIARKVWKNASHKKEARSAGATLMAVMADHLDDEEKWLKRADTTLDYVRTRLLEVQARRLMSQGKLARADALFAQAEKANAKQAAHSSAAANNAAITCQTRYQCTGNPKHLARGYRYLDAAHRLLPDNMVIVSNLAAHSFFLGGLTSLGGLFPVHRLRLASADVWTLLGALSDGPLRDRIVKGLQTSPKLRRCLDLTNQEEVLAPERLSGYRRELRLYVVMRSVTDLRKLKARLVQIKQLQTGQAARSAREYRAGKFDKRLVKEYTLQIKQRRKLVADLAGKGKAVQAAALLLLGTSYFTRSSLVRSADDARRAVAAFRKADKAWPALGARDHVLWAQVYVAILEEAEKLPALEKRWKRASRIYGLGTFLHRLIADKTATGMVRRLAARPELRQVLAARAQTVARRPSFRDWVVARLIGDEALIKVTRAVFKRPETRLSVEINARLTPWSESDQLEWRLFQQNK